MTDCAQLNGISRPIDAFVKYFLTVKPYHTKILEVIEAYKIVEEMTIDFIESKNIQIEIKNKPLCVGSGWGLEWDEECGFDAIECCDLFDCIGGFGLIYDNSDLLVTESIVSQNNTEDKVILNGNHLHDEHVQILNITNSNTLIVSGNKTALFNTHKIFLIIPYKTLNILSSDDKKFIVSGNHVSDFINRGEFLVFDTNNDDGVYSVTSAEYNISLNQTTVFVAQENISTNPMGGGFIKLKSKNKNNGAYQVQSVIFDGANTVVTVNNTNTFEHLNETVFGSVVFRTALIPNRRVWLRTVSDQELIEYKIVNSYYNSNNNTTEIIFAEKLYTDFDQIRLYGYSFGAGYDGFEECSVPKPQNIHVNIGEFLQIQIQNVIVIPPTPSITPTISITPSITPTITPTPSPTPIVTEGTYYVMSGGSLNSVKLDSGGNILSLGSNVQGAYLGVNTEGVSFKRNADNKIFYAQANMNAATLTPAPTGEVTFQENGNLEVFEVTESGITHSQSISTNLNQINRGMTATHNYVYNGGTTSINEDGESTLFITAYEINHTLAGPILTPVAVTPIDLATRLQASALGRIEVSPGIYEAFAFHYFGINGWQVSKLGVSGSDVTTSVNVLQEEMYSSNMVCTNLTNPNNPNERYILVYSSSVENGIQLVLYDHDLNTLSLAGAQTSLVRQDSGLIFNVTQTPYSPYFNEGINFLQFDEISGKLHVLFLDYVDEIIEKIAIGKVNVLYDDNTSSVTYEIVNVYYISNRNDLNFVSFTVLDNIVTLMSASKINETYDEFDTTYRTLIYNETTGYTEVDNSSVGNGLVRINNMYTVKVA
jgi:hypothetical protein